MKILIHEHVGSDASTVTMHMKKLAAKFYYDEMRFINSKVYSFKFDFIFEDEKDKRDYWLKILRLRRNIDSVRYCVENILEGKEPMPTDKNTVIKI